MKKRSYIGKIKCKRYCFILIVISIFMLSCSKQYPIKIYVANEGDGTISVIDAEKLEVIKTIKLDGMPHNVNVDPLGRYFYATNHEGENIKEDSEHDSDSHTGHIPYLRILDIRNNKLLHSIPMFEIAAHVVPSKDGRFVYVSKEGGNTVVEVDIDKEQIIRVFKVGEGPHGFVLSNDGKRLHVPNMRSNDVSIVDIESGNEERISLLYNTDKCETPVAMGISNDDRYSFVT